MALLKALAAQTLGLVFTACFMRVWPDIFHGTGRLLLTQGIVAALSSGILRQPPWWPVIHLLFLPAAVTLLNLAIPPHWYLLIVLILTLIFWGTVKGDVPLFLSSSAVAGAIIEIVNAEHAQQFADLGAGVGSVTIPLAKHSPHVKIDAFERAPLPWAINHWRSRKLINIKSSRESFWSCDLAQYDVVFAFLSPAAMPGLGAKIRLSMRPGSLFISSSFPVPEWEPEFIKQVCDRRQTQLFCYRVGFL